MTTYAEAPPTQLTHRPVLLASAAVSASAALVAGVLQIVHEPSGADTVVGVAEHTLIGMLSLFLVAQLPLLAWLAGTRRLPFAVSAVGMVALATLSTVSNVLGHDLGVFEWIALPANLFWLGGLIGIAVVASRAGGVPRTLAVLLPFTWVAAIPLSSFGGGILAGAYFVAIGLTIRKR